MAGVKDFQIEYALKQIADVRFSETGVNAVDTPNNATFNVDKITPDGHVVVDGKKDTPAPGIYALKVRNVDKDISTDLYASFFRQADNDLGRYSEVEVGSTIIGATREEVLSSLEMTSQMASVSTLADGPSTSLIAEKSLREVIHPQ